MSLTSDKRRKEVLAAVTMDSGAKVSELSRRFDVSMETIRKDMKYWEEAGVLKKTHGGAVLASDVTSLRHITERIVENIDVKNAIAAKAVELVPENATIFIDTGSTMVCAAKLLNLRSGLTVLTNSILAASKLAETGNRVMMLGGVLQGDVLGTYGAWATTALRTVLIDVAFLGCSGFKGFDGPADKNLNDIELRRAVMNRAKRNIVLADSGKLMISGIMSYCDWDDIECLITSPADDPGAFSEIEKHTRVIFARHGGT